MIVIVNTYIIIILSNIWSVVIIYMIIIIYMVNMSMNSYISLPKLVQYRSWSLSIDGWYLSHYLTIIMSYISIIFAACNSLFCWTYLLCTCSFSAVSMIPIFSLVCFIWRGSHIEEVSTTLLIIINSTFF